MRPVIGITAAADNDALRLKPAYVSAVEKSGGIPVVLPILDRASDLTDVIDGLILTGGGDISPDYYHEKAVAPPECFRFEKRERIDFDAALLGEALRKGKPVLAICYGMQLLNVVWGGTLFQDIECQIQKVIDHTTGMHEIEIIDPLSDDLRRRYTVNSSHHQAVKDVGDGLSVFAVAGDGVIEGIYKSDYTFCVGVQWHPERIFFDPLSAWLFESLAEKAAEIRRRR